MLAQVLLLIESFETHMRTLANIFSAGGNLGRSPKPYKMKSWVEAAAARGGFCVISCPRTWQLGHDRSTLLHHSLVTRPSLVRDRKFLREALNPKP
jgi:hypothetical protein